MSVCLPYTESLRRFRDGLANDALSHRCVVTFPSCNNFFIAFKETFASLVDGSVTLPEHPMRQQPIGEGSLYGAGIEDAFLSSRGDGFARTSEPRGFMPGMGETYHYYMLVADDVRIDVEDWYEDNIADPDTSVFTVRARSADRMHSAVRALKYALSAQGAGWKDPFARTPKRAERARVEAALQGFTDAALAWSSLGEANARWTFAEEVFETCSSCGGSALDPYAGACYACTHDGKNIVGFRWTPHPPTMQQVLAYASDLPVMKTVDAALCTLMERLAPWGATSTTNIEWMLEAPSHPSGAAPDSIPNCMVPVFRALRAALPDPTIPEGGVSVGWFSQGSRAWEEVAHKKPFAERANPFEPLRTIMAAGYRVVLVGNDTTPVHVRLSVDA